MLKGSTGLFRITFQKRDPLHVFQSGHGRHMVVFKKKIVLLLRAAEFSFMENKNLKKR